MDCVHPSTVAAGVGGIQRDPRRELQGANLQARADLMRQIAELIQAEGWKQVEAAERCGVTQPRINDLLRGRVSRSSLDSLVNIATALGRRVNVEFEAA